MKFCTCSFLRKALQWGEWVLPQDPALQRNNGWTKCYFLLVVFVCCCSGVWRTILGPALTSCISECWGRRHEALFPSDLRSAWLQHMLLAPREASPWVVRGDLWMQNSVHVLACYSRLHHRGDAAQCGAAVTMHVLSLLLPYMAILFKKKNKKNKRKIKNLLLTACGGGACSTAAECLLAVSWCGS